jgi:hypothetical protein
VLTVSRIDPRKGLRVLPEVVRQLQAGGARVSLDIVGPVVGRPGEDERLAILHQAERLGVGADVQALGPVALDRLLPLYRDYDVFVLPTLPGEGIPRVLLEAMSGGVPIVTTRVAGIPSLIQHELNGWLVDEPDAGVVADAVARIIADAPLRRRLIANGYHTARRFTLEAQAARMLTQVASRLQVTLKQPATVPAAAGRERPPEDLFVTIACRRRRRAGGGADSQCLDPAAWDRSMALFKGEGPYLADVSSSVRFMAATSRPGSAWRGCGVRHRDAPRRSSCRS